jgi:predicted transcriptional regulator
LHAEILMSVITIRVEPEFSDQLKALARSRRVPASSVIREILREGYHARIRAATGPQSAAKASLFTAGKDLFLRRQAEELMYLSVLLATLIQNSPLLGKPDERDRQMRFAKESASNFLKDFEARWSTLKG